MAYKFLPQEERKESTESKTSNDLLENYLNPKYNNKKDELGSQFKEAFVGRFHDKKKFYDTGESEKYIKNTANFLERLETSINNSSIPILGLSNVISKRIDDLNSTLNGKSNYEFGEIFGIWIGKSFFTLNELKSEIDVFEQNIISIQKYAVVGKTQNISDDFTNFIKAFNKVLETYKASSSSNELHKKFYAMLKTNIFGKGERTVFRILIEGSVDDLSKNINTFMSRQFSENKGAAFNLSIVQKQFLPKTSVEDEANNVSWDTVKSGFQALDVPTQLILFNLFEMHYGQNWHNLGNQNINAQFYLSVKHLASLPVYARPKAAEALLGGFKEGKGTLFSFSAQSFNDACNFLVPILGMYSNGYAFAQFSNLCEIIPEKISTIIQTASSELAQKTDNARVRNIRETGAVSIPGANVLLYYGPQYPFGRPLMRNLESRGGIGGSNVEILHNLPIDISKERVSLNLITKQQIIEAVSSAQHNNIFLGIDVSSFYRLFDFEPVKSIPLGWKGSGTSSVIESSISNVKIEGYEKTASPAITVLAPTIVDDDVRIPIAYTVPSGKYLSAEYVKSGEFERGSFAGTTHFERGFVSTNLLMDNEGKKANLIRKINFITQADPNTNATVALERTQNENYIGHLFVKTSSLGWIYAYSYEMSGEESNLFTNKVDRAITGSFAEVGTGSITKDVNFVGRTYLLTYNTVGMTPSTAKNEKTEIIAGSGAFQKTDKLGAGGFGNQEGEFVGTFNFKSSGPLQKIVALGNFNMAKSKSAFDNENKRIYYEAALKGILEKGNLKISFQPKGKGEKEPMFLSGTGDIILDEAGSENKRISFGTLANENVEYAVSALYKGYSKELLSALSLSYSLGKTTKEKAIGIVSNLNKEGSWRLLAGTKLFSERDNVKKYDNTAIGVLDINNNAKMQGTLYQMNVNESTVVGGSFKANFWEGNGGIYINSNRSSAGLFKNVLFGSEKNNLVQGYVGVTPKETVDKLTYGGIYGGSTYTLYDKSNQTVDFSTTAILGTQRYSGKDIKNKTRYIQAEALKRIYSNKTETDYSSLYVYGGTALQYKPNNLEKAYRGSTGVASLSELGLNYIMSSYRFNSQTEQRTSDKFISINVGAVSWATGIKNKHYYGVTGGFNSTHILGVGNVYSTVFSGRGTFLIPERSKRVNASIEIGVDVNF